MSTETGKALIKRYERYEQKQHKIHFYYTARYRHIITSKIFFLPSNSFRFYEATNLPSSSPKKRKQNMEPKYTKH